jgi:hypothetical protein
MRFAWVLALIALGCGSNASSNGGAGGNSATASASTATGSGGSGPLPAVANTRVQMQVLWSKTTSGGPTGATSSSTGSGDPNDLFLRISDVGVTCSSPSTTLTCGHHWSLIIIVPPIAQQIGKFDLAKLLSSSFSVTGVDSPQSPGACMQTNGALSGTLEIVSIDKKAAHFHVSASAPIGGVDPSGDYSAPRCP